MLNKSNISTIHSFCLDIIRNNNEELIEKTKNDLLAIDQNYNTSKQIVQEILSYLSKLNLQENFIRRRYHA